MGKYHYQIQKQETKTSGVVDLVKVKKTSRGGKKPSKVSNRQMLEEILIRLDKQDKRWEHQEEFNNQVLTTINTIIKVNNLKTK